MERNEKRSAELAQHAGNPKRTLPPTPSLMNLPTELLQHIWLALIAGCRTVAAVQAVYVLSRTVCRALQAATGSSVFWQSSAPWLDKHVLTAVVANGLNGAVSRLRPFPDFRVLLPHMTCFLRECCGLSNADAELIIVEVGPRLRHIALHFPDDDLDGTRHALLLRIAASAHHVRDLYLENFNGDQASIASLRRILAGAGAATLQQFRMLLSDLSQVSPNLPLFEPLGLCAGLKRLELVDCAITAHGAAVLGVVLPQRGRSLLDVCLGVNVVGANGANAILRGLQHCQRLVVLEMYSTGLGSLGVETIVDGMLGGPALPDLAVLKLGENVLHAPSALPLIHLFLMLHRLPFLAELHLNDTQLSDPACAGALATLSRTLPFYPALRVLNLAHNNLVDRHLAVLLPGLGRCVRLTDLCMHGNLVSDRMRQQLADALSAPGRVVATTYDHCPWPGAHP